MLWNLTIITKKKQENLNFCQVAISFLCQALIKFDFIRTKANYTDIIEYLLFPTSHWLVQQSRGMWVSQERAITNGKSEAAI